MRFAELDAVTVDGYGTLLVLDSPAARLRDALAARGAIRSEQEVGRAFAAEAGYYKPRSHLGRDGPSLAELRRECVAVFLEALENPLPVEEFVDDFIEALVFRPISGAEQTLHDLKKREIRLAVVANWDCSLPGQLTNLGLDRFFSAVVTSASAGAAKPDPAIFAVALERLGGVAAGRALHIGDELADKEGSRAAGMRFRPAPLAGAFEGWT